MSFAEAISGLQFCYILFKISETQIQAEIGDDWVVERPAWMYHNLLEERLKEHKKNMDHNLVMALTLFMKAFVCPLGKM